LKVLIVEDNPTNMKFAAMLLKKNGYEVLEAWNAETGMEMARSEKPDLMLLDIHLPGMDGLTAVKHLRADESTKDLKIVALTALAMRGDKERILSEGCDGYIAKPIRYKEFLDMVKSFDTASDEGDKE
jgi:two-component system cell cycle response regulator DivK